LRVPTEFGKSIDVAARAIDKLKPDIVLCLGQAGGRSRMSVERVAINVDDAGIADNAGAQPIDKHISRDAPAAYFCTVPIKAMVEAMSHAEVPAEVSNTAGTFVCNHLIYGVLHHIAARGYATRAGFMHVPFLESQIINRAGTPALSLATMIEGTKAAIIATIKHRADVKRVGGALH
jgi:pyroglutamyl-peptidase